MKTTEERKAIGFAECTAAPVFLYQVRHSKPGRYGDYWDTRRVFYTRPEAEQYALSQTHNWKWWRVYCVPAEGELREVMSTAESVADKQGAA
jgi:hypothetical protein